MASSWLRFLLSLKLRTSPSDVSRASDRPPTIPDHHRAHRPPARPASGRALKEPRSLDGSVTVGEVTFAGLSPCASKWPVSCPDGGTSYARGNRARNTAILDELVELTGWHRDHARAALRDGWKLKVVKDRAPQGPTYGPRSSSR